MFISYFSGENMNIYDVNTIQKNSLILYGTGYSNNNVEYKLSNVSSDYELLIIGTSRVMQFQTSDFVHSTYNAGGIISRVEQIHPLLAYFDEKNHLPKYIILGLDHYFFNESWNEISDYAITNYSNRIRSSISRPNVNYRLIARDIVSGRLSIRELINSENEDNIGVNALINGKGFRNDGFLVYGDYKILEDENLLDFEDSLNRIEGGHRRFEYGQEVYAEALQQINLILDFAEEKNIQIIGFLPPYAPLIYEEMINSKNYDYIRKLPAELIEVFDQYDDHTFYDFSFVEGFDNTYFVDGFHGDYRLYSHIGKIFNEKFENKID